MSTNEEVASELRAVVAIMESDPDAGPSYARKVGAALLGLGPGAMRAVAGLLEDRAWGKHDVDRILTRALGVGYCQRLSDALERQDGEDLIDAAKRAGGRAVEHRERDGYKKALVRAMARRCGLEDPDAFAAKGGVLAAGTFAGDAVRAKYGDGWREGGPMFFERARGTGRTTRMLLEALVALEAGFTVEIVVVDVDQARELRERLDALASKADAHHGSTHVAWTWSGGRAGSGHFDEGRDVRLVDHSAQEAAGG